MKMKSEFQYPGGGYQCEPPHDLDPWLLAAMEVGWYFEVPKLWGTKWILRTARDNSDFNEDFVLVREGGKRFIERVDK